jgi:hypothetical protein
MARLSVSQTPQRPGRSCPVSYAYSPTVFARAADFKAEVVYVVGGLYGNVPALREIERMAALEPVTPQLVFNGDFHWFDIDPAVFAAIENGVHRHRALRGNVETELAGGDESHGCGCAYPEQVPDADVDRSNEILARLRLTTRRLDSGEPVRERLAALPMHVVAEVGGARIGIVHGDAWALAGWRFAHDSLHDAARATLIETAFEQAAVDGFASAHTCLPALRTFDHALGEHFVVNNGAAGMPNFAGTRNGLLTRIATLPVPPALTATRRYGADVADVHVDALAVNFDLAAWDREFAGQWPAGTAACLSYSARIAHGPGFHVDDALGRAPLRACHAAVA